MSIRRLVSLCLATALMLSVCSVEAFAFGGYAHWEIADRAVDENNIPTTNNYAQAYMSGTLLADIGKANWDNKYTKSDSLEFAQKMMEITPPNVQGTYFARGWRSHVYQDANGSVSSILNDGDGYRVNCGQIDEYLRDDLDISCPINGTANLYVVYEMIRNTYKALDGFEPTNDQIDAEIEAMYLAYHTQIALNFSGMNATQINNMNAQFNNLAETCYITSASMININENTYMQNSVTSVEDLFQRERNNPNKRDSILQIEEDAKMYAHLELISYKNGVAELQFVINDYDAYQGLVDQYANIIAENTELIAE